MKLIPSALAIGCLLGFVGCVAGAPDEETAGDDADAAGAFDDQPSVDGDQFAEYAEAPEPGTSKVTYALYPPVTLANSQVSHNLVKDGAYLYWTNADSLMRVPTSGGTPTRMAGSLRAPYGLAIDSSNLYWAEYGNSTDSHCYIKKMPKIGGTITKLYTGVYGCTGLTIDSVNVYWTNYAAGLIGTINKGGSGLVLRYVGGRPREIAVDSDTNMIWTNEARGTIEGFTLPSDGDIETLASAQAPTHLRIWGDYVYWTNYDHGTVMRAYKWCHSCGGPPIKTMASGQAGPMGIDIAGAWLFWTNSVNGALMKAYLSDGTHAARITTVEIGAEKLLVRYRASRTPPSLYWVNPTAKKVMKLDQY